MISSKSDLRDILEFMNLPLDTPIFDAYCTFANNERASIINPETPKLSESSSFNDRERFYIELFKNQTNNYNNILYIYLKKDGEISKVTYYHNSVESNNKGPTYICFDMFGSLYEVTYRDCGKCHRNGFPAFIRYKNGIIDCEQYYINNKAHNPVGPAFRMFVDGKWINKFYINDKKITSTEFFKLLKSRTGESWILENT